MDIWAPENGPDRGWVLIDGDRTSAIRARELAQSLLLAADFADEVRPRLATHAEGIAFAERFGFTDPEEE